MAAQYLRDFDEQKQALAILEDFRFQTGRSSVRLIESLKKGWRWPMGNAEASTMSESQFNAAMMQSMNQQVRQLQMSRFSSAPHLHQYPTAPVAQILPQSNYGHPFSGQLLLTTAQGGHTFAEQSQFMIAGKSNDIGTNSRQILQAPIDDIGSHAQSLFASHSDPNYSILAPNSSAAQSSFMQMTTGDTFPPLYNAY